MAKQTKAKIPTNTRRASLLVADEILYSLGGKVYLQGMYLNDISINADQVVAPQLVFMFIFETEIENSFTSITLEITLPGSEAVKAPITIAQPVIPHQDRTHIMYRLPLLLSAPILRPGRIEARIIHDRGEILANAIWITKAPHVAANVEKLD